MAKTCPLTGNHDLKVSVDERLPSDDEVAGERVNRKDEIEERIRQGATDKEITEEFGYKDRSTSASIRTRMRKAGRYPKEIKRHDPDDLSDLKDVEEDEKTVDLRALGIV